MAGEPWIGVGLVLMSVLASGLVVRSGVRTYRQGNAIDRARRLQDSSTSGGFVSTAGTINGPVDGHSLESELGGTPCVAYSYEVTLEKSATPGEDVNRSPRVSFDKDSGEGAIPFIVDADGRRVHVDGSDAHVDWSSVDYERIPEGQVVRNRGGIRAILGLLRMIGGRADRRRRYREACLRAGDRVHVIGTSRASEDGTDVSLEKGRGGPFVVSANAPDSVADGFRTRAKGRFMWAAVILGVAGFFAYLTAGIL